MIGWIVAVGCVAGAWASLYHHGRNQYLQGAEDAYRAFHERAERPLLAIRRWPQPVLPKDKLN